MTLEETVGPSLRLVPPRARAFSYEGLAGQVAEFSGWNHPACISLAAGLIRECQEAGGLCAWIGLLSDDEAGLFFPPDFHRGGIDCGRLPVLWADSAPDGFSLAERLMRSRGFAMVVMDLTGRRFHPPADLGRLHRLARSTGCLLLCLTRRPPGEASLHPMVFFHAHGASRPLGDGSYEVSLQVQKDKNHAPAGTVRRRYGAPAGLS